MTRYNHAMTLAFMVITEKEDGEDLTYQQLKESVLQRLSDLDPEDFKEAVLPPFDTYVESD